MQSPPLRSRLCTPSPVSRRATWLCAGLILSCLVACSGSGKGGETDQEPLAGEVKKREAPRVRAVPVVREEMVRTLSTTQAIESEREVPILPRIGGLVTELLVEEGYEVEANEHLATIDPRDAQAALDDALVAQKEVQNQGPLNALAVKEAAEQIERAKLAYNQAVRDVDRNERAGLISENELEKLRTARDSAFRDGQSAGLSHEKALADVAGHETALSRANLAVKLQELNRSYAEIRAPFPGVIATRNIQVGNTASSAEPAFVITDPDQLKVVIFRPQKELAFFSAAAADPTGDNGVTIVAYPDALPGEAYAGVIRFVSPTIDATSGSFRLTIDLDQPGHEDKQPRLMPGMLVRLAIVTERHPDALVVPKRALRREGERHFLFAVRDKRAIRIDVIEGLSTDETVEVTPRKEGALDEGDLVVVVGNRDLEDGQEVMLEKAPGEDDEGEESAPESEEPTTDPTTGDEVAEAPAVEDGESFEDSPGGAEEPEAGSAGESSAAKESGETPDKEG